MRHPQKAGWNARKKERKKERRKGKERKGKKPPQNTRTSRRLVR